MSDHDANELLQERFPRLTLHARGRLMTTAGGNPLALLELLIALDLRRASSTALLGCCR